MRKYCKKLFLTTIFIFLIAMGLRFMNLEAIKNNPYFGSPIMDEKYHDEWAQEIATGKLFDKSPFYRAPGYPYFLGLISTIFGHDYFIPRLIGIIFGALSCVLVYLIGREMFSCKIGILAGLLACFYGMLIYFDSMLLAVYLEIFLSLFGIYWLIRWTKTQKNWHILIAGVFWGLVTIVRPNFLIFVPVLAVYILLCYKKLSLIKKLKVIALFICGILPFLIAVMVINVVVGKDAVILSWNGGVNLYFGNNPASNGWSATSTEINATWWGGYRDAIVIAERATGHELRPSQVSNYWFKRGFAFIFSQPFAWAKLMVKKIYLFCNSFEISNNQSVEAFREYSFLMRLPILSYGVIFALSILGIILSIKEKRTWPIILYILSYAFSIVIFFVTARYRMPIIPFFFIFSSYTIFWIIEQNDLRKAALITVGFIVLFIISNSDLYGTRIINNSLIHVSLGNRYFEKGDFSEAMKEYNKSLEHDPRNIDAMNALGNTYMMIGNRNEAMNLYRKSLSIAPSMDALCKMGIIHSIQGTVDSAQHYFNTAIARDSTNPEPYYYLGMHYANYRNQDNAVYYLELALKYYPEPQYERNIHYNLGKLYIEIDNFDKAKQHLFEAGVNYKDVRQILKHIQ